MRWKFTCIIILCILINAQKGFAQLKITSVPNAQALVQRLVGDGITISNISFTGNIDMTGYFNNISGTNIGIDSGIVLTNGFAKTGRTGSPIGLDWDGSDMAYFVDAHN